MSKSSRLLTKVNVKDGFAVRTLDPGLEGEVCRTIDQKLENL